MPEADPGRGELIREAHARLETRFDAARDALRGSDATLARAALDALRRDVEAHFEQESRLYFPTIRALQPEREPAVSSLAEEHARLRGLLETSAGHLDAREPSEAARAFERFLEAFRGHEETEDELARSLEGVV